MRLKVYFATVMMRIKFKMTLLKFGKTAQLRDRQNIRHSLTVLAQLRNQNQVVKSTDLFTLFITRSAEVLQSKSAIIKYIGRVIILQRKLKRLLLKNRMKKIAVHQFLLNYIEREKAKEEMNASLKIKQKEKRIQWEFISPLAKEEISKGYYRMRWLDNQIQRLERFERTHTLQLDKQIRYASKINSYSQECKSLVYLLNLPPAQQFPLVLEKVKSKLQRAGSILMAPIVEPPKDAVLYVNYGQYRNPHHLYFLAIPQKHELIKIITNAIELQKHQNKSLARKLSLQRKQTMKAQKKENKLKEQEESKDEKIEEKTKIKSGSRLSVLDKKKSMAAKIKAIAKNKENYDESDSEEIDI